MIYKININFKMLITIMFSLKGTKLVSNCMHRYNPFQKFPEQIPFAKFYVSK